MSSLNFSDNMYSPHVFQTSGYSTKNYSMSFGPMNSIWSIQNAPVWASKPLTGGNYPDPKLSYRATGALEQVRKSSYELLSREQQTFRQLRFNTKISGTGGSYTALRENNTDSYTYRMLSQPLTSRKNFEVLALVALGILIALR